ncbi:MAG: hypothetical protein ABII12_06765 [Planctomycetota bacterium]
MQTSPFRAAHPYPLFLNAVAVLGGIIDPLAGVFTTLLRIFWRSRLPNRADTPQRRRRGLTLILGGIEGPSRYAASMARGLLMSGYRGSVAVFPWNRRGARGIPLLYVLRNLMNRRHHERWSDRLVRTILDYRSEYPNSPVNLLAQSGGCWVTLRALEKLPAGVCVRSVVWLAPSISPARDIAAAVSRCQHGLVSFGGPGDFFFLGMGTLLLGTSDRVHTPSAGWIGWRHRPQGFTECRWRPAWIKFGYLGNHTSTSARRFIEDFVAPQHIR